MTQFMKCDRKGYEMKGCKWYRICYLCKHKKKCKAEKEQKPLYVYMIDGKEVSEKEFIEVFKKLLGVVPWQG